MSPKLLRDRVGPWTPWFHRRPSVYCRNAFERLGTDVDGVAMAALGIMEHFDVIEHLRLRCIDRLVGLPGNSLLLERTAERFGYRDVPAIAAAAHARLEVVRGQELPAVKSPVL